ncbi:DNA-binding protein [Horticoccus luteus]|uniref:DNA-(apurinic or apyrimidinic site) lyase n=1 Tax=Horticoccus luteus TaxID=2862869 RepID=A0A8F9TUP3_9BACT|nr:DNA glycosylase [Horticoccus luteus]QYM79395.1 DNA-binding protein [Horticoccus luteus]
MNTLSDSWTAWQPLPSTRGLSAAVLAETLDGGQAFRWHAQTDGVYQGAWSNHVARLRATRDGVAWSAPAALAPATSAALADYFVTRTDWRALADTLPWRSDAHLAACLAAFPGLRLLRQPFGETLLGFLCSATKQIVQIKQMVALLATRHGAPILPSSAAAAFHRLPTWPELAAVPETELRACLLGFRARYISATAKFLAAHPGWLEETEAAPYALAKARLCTLPGVGEKVADCVLLFGAGRLEAFPVDVWILKTMAARYGLVDWGSAQVAHFGRTHFGPLAGLAQQYLFAYERAAARRAA